MAIHCKRSGGLTRLLRRPAKTARGRGAAPSLPAPAATLDARRQIRDALGGSGRAGLRVSRPGDAAEREAGRSAEAVLRMPDPVGPDARRRDGAEAPVARSAHLGLPGSGRALSRSERAFFEPRFGRYLGGVRVHDDAASAARADQLHARAFTVGNDIGFARGEYAAGTHAGRQLMAHELAHVVQQGRSPAPTAQVFRQPKPRANWVLRRPPDIRQSGLTCWAAALASWLLIKGIVQTGFDSDFLIRHYRGTDCTDASDALIGDSNADVEAVFAEWRVLLDLDTTIRPNDFSPEMAKRLIERHGHFLLILHTNILHAMVVYGVEVNPDNPADFSLLVMDPLVGYRTVTPWNVEQDMSIGVGMERGAGPAPCRSRPRR
ncbi:MAG: DUF4157 domain-containing protein [Rhodocyclaceae bacterium]|nr:DUF4157 domain-containing protein [Rhodocyclaceae bacterium]